jgi:hypothetical protein
MSDTPITQPMPEPNSPDTEGHQPLSQPLPGDSNGDTPLSQELPQLNSPDQQEGYLARQREAARDEPANGGTRERARKRSRD